MTSFIAAVGLYLELLIRSISARGLSIGLERDIFSTNAMNQKRFAILFAILVLTLACQTTDALLSYLSPEPTEAPTRTRVPTREVGDSAQPTAPLVAIIVTPTPAEISATAADNANIRTLPSTGAAIAARITKGQQLTLTGRTAAKDWYVVRLPANPNAQGWILASLVRAEGTDQLPVVQPGAVPPPYPGR